MARTAQKTETLNCRVTPEAKARLARAAEGERRSLAGMLEVMILDWSAHHQVKTPKSPATKAKR